MFSSFKLSFSTLFLAISILQRTLYSPNDGFLSLPIRDLLSQRDQAKLQVYLSMSIASKYEDRVAFTFEEVAPALKFEAGSQISNVLKPDILRACEGEILKKLTFRVGDHQSTRYSTIHDNIRLGA